MKHCLVCRQNVGPLCCPVEAEYCPNLGEQLHIGVDIGSKDVTVVVITSPTDEPGEPAFTVQEVITFEQLDKDCQHLKPSSYFQPTNWKECSPCSPWTPYDSTWIE